MPAALAPSERFQLLLAETARVEDLRAWLGSARPGEQEIYATGLTLPRETEAVRLVTRWKNEGLVTTLSRRDPADGRRWQYLIELRAAAKPAPRTDTLDHPTRGQMRSLLSTLRRCAEQGRVCPSDSQLARELGLGTGERGRKKAAYLMKLARERGDIASESRGRNAPRVVTIMAPGRARGKATADG